MSWLEDEAKNTVFKYRNVDDDNDVVIGNRANLEKIFKQTVRCEPNDMVTVDIGGTCKPKKITYAYAGFEPKKLSLITKVSFEKNGRTGTKMSYGGGKVSYMADSKRNYLEKATEDGERSQERGLTKPFKEAIGKDLQDQLIQREKSRGKVSRHKFSAKEAIEEAELLKTGGAARTAKKEINH